jgi:hypothetical protein
MNGLAELDRTILLCRDYVAADLTDYEICQRLQSQQILIVSEHRNLRSHAGQTALATLVSLVSRMGMQVALDIPDIKLALTQPPLQGASIESGLLAVNEAFVASATITTRVDLRPDLTFALGDTPIEDYRAPCWRLTGGEWSGRIDMDGVGRSWPWTVEFPVGSMISAALAATEAFKFALRRLRLRSELNRAFLQASQSSGWDFALGATPIKGFDLGWVDFISAGAISQAALYVLARIPGIRMRGRIFDDDITGVSNLNRNMLTFREDVGRAKVHIVARRCPQLAVEPIAARYGNGSPELEKLAPRVVVGVDDIPSRWEVQRRGPAWLVVGGTSHFNVSSSIHRLGEPCSGCLHPIDEPGPNVIPTISFVSFWAGLITAVRLLQEAVGRPCPSGRQHLWLSPLRMDLPRAAMWSPVPARKDCPVKCPASRSLTQIDPLAA